jgi:hypothetical protein
MRPPPVRPRAADDFAAIRARLTELHDERTRAEAQPDLPPIGSTRWDGRAKAAVVLAVRRGTLQRREAFRRYMLSEEELSQWEETFEKDGIAGLQAGSLWPR